MWQGEAERRVAVHFHPLLLAVFFSFFFGTRSVSWDWQVIPYMKHISYKREKAVEDTYQAKRRIDEKT
jgi:hypothetical protein